MVKKTSKPRVSVLKPKKEEPRKRRHRLCPTSDLESAKLEIRQEHAGMREIPTVLMVSCGGGGGEFRDHRFWAGREVEAAAAA